MDTAVPDAGPDTDLGAPDGDVSDVGGLDLSLDPDLGTPDSGVDLGIEPPDSGVDLGVEPPDSGVDLGVEPPDSGAPDTGVDLGPQPGIVVSSLVGMISEDGSEGTFTVVLTSPPTQDVAFSVSVVGGGATLSLATLRFTPTNWDMPQTVTVSAVDDDAVDGVTLASISFGAAVSNDLNYAGRVATGFGFTIFDDDVAGTQTTALDFGLCDVSGAVAYFDVRLTAQPTDTVTVPLAAPGDGSLAVFPATLDFGSGNWNAPQVVTVSFAGTDIQGNTTRAIELGPLQSADVSFNGVAVEPFAVSVCDVGSAGIVVEEVGGAPLGTPVTVSEAGLTHDVQVRLATQPTGPVLVDVFSNDTTEVVTSTFVLMFDASNWNVAQVVSFEGIDDLVGDGLTTTAVDFVPHSDVDPAYAYAPYQTVLVDNQAAPYDALLGVPMTTLNCNVRSFGMTSYNCVECSIDSMTDGDSATDCRITGQVPALAETVLTWTLAAPTTLDSLRLDCVVDAATLTSLPLLDIQQSVGGPWIATTFTPGTPLLNPGTVAAVRLRRNATGTQGPYFECSSIVAMATTP